MEGNENSIKIYVSVWMSFMALIIRKLLSLKGSFRQYMLQIWTICYRMLRINIPGKRIFLDFNYRIKKC